MAFSFQGVLLRGIGKGRYWLARPLLRVRALGAFVVKKVNYLDIGTRGLLATFNNSSQRILC